MLLSVTQYMEESYQILIKTSPTYQNSDIRSKKYS